jgi:hypothetical protein
MPTVLRVGPYRFFFYAGDRGEPPHVHVERDACEAKFWLRPVRLAANFGFRPAELRDIERIVSEHEELLEQRWNEYFHG